MEDPARPLIDAVTYAVLSLIFQLVATQSSVLNLWYSRRCYERSRGEMITMIFEKTLGRKIIGASKRASAAKPSDENSYDPSLRPKYSKVHPRTLCTSLCGRIKRFLLLNHSAKEIKEPASMGKILNLMR